MPEIRFEDEFLLAVEKEPGVHTAPLRANADDRGETLLERVIRERPGLATLPGRKDCEPGLLHRLDLGTSGLVLIAKTEACFRFLLARQEEGKFLKEYLALCRSTAEGLSGAKPGRGREENGFIRSRFRSYGPRGARVAPLAPEASETGPVYETEILRKEEQAGIVEFRLRLSRGFRHQVRAHLAWIGFPIIGDEDYGPAFGAAASPRLMLHACALRFPHPSGDREISVECPPPPDFRA